MLEETVQRNVTIIAEALNWLVANEFLIEEPVKGSDPIFRLNQEKAAEATRFLAATGNPRKERRGRT